MHHVRIPLDLHHVGELHRAIIGHAADVVAPQVDQHDVLGTLLGIGQQLFGQRPVLGFVGTAAPRARQRPDRHQHRPRRAPGSPASSRSRRNRRRADRNRNGLGIDDPQDAVDVERIGLGLDRESLAGNDLKDVAGLDVFLAMTHDRFIFGAGEIRARLERDRRFRVDVAQTQVRARRRPADRPARRSGRTPLRRPPSGSIPGPTCACATTRIVLRMWSNRTIRS